MNIKYNIHFAGSHNNFWLILFEYILKHFTRIAIYIGNIKILNQLTSIKHYEGNTMPNINTHRAHPFFTTLTAHGGIFLPPDEKSIISRTP